MTKSMLDYLTTEQKKEMFNIKKKNDSALEKGYLTKKQASISLNNDIDNFVRKVICNLDWNKVLTSKEKHDILNKKSRTN